MFNLLGSDIILSISTTVIKCNKEKQPKSGGSRVIYTLLISTTTTHTALYLPWFRKNGDSSGSRNKI